MAFSTSLAIEWILCLSLWSQLWPKLSDIYNHPVTSLIYFLHVRTPAPYRPTKGSCLQPVVTTSLSRAVTASVTPSSTSSCSTTATVSHSPSVKFVNISATEPIHSASIPADEPVKSANVSASESLLKSEKCQYKTKHIYLFSEHMREKHRIYKFDVCNFINSSEKGLSLHKTKSHTQLHKDHSEYKCEKCRYTARDVNNLKRLTHLKQIVLLNCCHTKPPL